MTPSDDPSPPRRPIFFPVVIATVFLTIIGMTAGYVLGERDHKSTQAGPQATPAQGQSASPVLSGPRCPDEAIQSASVLERKAVDLRQKFKIITTNGTVAWICADNTGRLYYQGKTGGVNSKLVPGTNGLFMDQVTDDGDDQYVAVNKKGFRIEVSREHLVVHSPDGSAQTYEVPSAE